MVSRYSKGSPRRNDLPYHRPIVASMLAAAALNLAQSVWISAGGKL
jgi:hypothetical protein